MSKHQLTQADQVYYGKARYARAWATLGHPGVRITPQLLAVAYGAIATASANAVSLSQSVSAAASFLLNGALGSGGVATFPTPRNVVAAWTGTSVLTITGTDEYGSIVTENSASGTSHTGKKAFKTITAITSSGAITAATVGTGVQIGLPYRVGVGGLVIAKTDSATDAATLTVADATTATATTGDVRGTVSFAAAPNGTAVQTAYIQIYDPSSKSGAFGILQFGSTDAA